MQQESQDGDCQTKFQLETLHAEYNNTVRVAAGRPHHWIIPSLGKGGQQGPQGIILQPPHRFLT